MRSFRLTAGLTAASAIGFLAMDAASQPAQTFVPDVVTVDLTKAVNTIVPDDAFGAALDGVGRGEVEKYLTTSNIAKMHSSGIRRATYRTREELGIEVWHFSEEGTWSDPAHRQGYWTSSDHPSNEPRVTWGYSLPRRGDTIDNANNLGYSRIDDGDPKTFWKSNPYLDRRFTGAAETRPQFVAITLDAKKPIDAARILWAAPFARHFLVQYWVGVDEYDHTGHWATFPHGDRTLSDGSDDAVMRLADRPVATQYLRILLLQSSETAPPGSTDIRDHLGYAIRELYFGLARPDGELDDVLRHGKGRNKQSVIQVSSTDPWHRARDRDRDTEQPSLDMVFKVGLNGGKDLMVPVGVFYDTPENAAAEIRYIKRRGFPVHEVEIGEEADGQFIYPEDYADLYLEVAKAVHAVDPALKLGGPSMQGAMTGTWPDWENGASWIGRFVARLKARDGMNQFQFFSFEHYAFDDVCSPLGATLRDETDLLNKLMAATQAAGVPRSIPWYISEYGLSPFSGRAMSELPGALYDADVAAHFLSVGGTAAFMYGFPPSDPMNETFPCAGYGGMMLFQADDKGRAHWPMPQYFAERMMMLDWAAPADKPHSLYAAHSRLMDEKGVAMVTAYPLYGGNGQWSILLLNRDEFHGHRVRIAVNSGGKERPLFSPDRQAAVTQYSPEQYHWLVRGEDSHPTKDLPPVQFVLDGGAAINLPSFSVTVVRGSGPWPSGRQ